MKLVIQIPAWNEEQLLGRTLASLPSRVEGFDTVEVQVIDDGSEDRTAEIARRHGAAVVSLGAHQGLATAFETGVKEALHRGADVIVNTDADNQYDSGDIGRLVQPILEGRADMVIGDRQVARLKHFSLTKRLLQWLGSWVVRKLSKTGVADATSGFRAISRQAALRLHVFTRFTYTLETILQAGEAGFRVVSVPVRVNPNPHRKSRLFGSNVEYVIRSLESLARIVVLYNPLRIFLRVGLVPVALGLLLLARFGWFYLEGHSPAGHVQSLLLSVILIVTGFQVCVLGLVADLIAVNRRLVEEIERRERDRVE